MRQTCKACGRPDKFDYNVPDDVWLSVVPARLANRVVCLFCFDDFAKQGQVDYAGSLIDLWFAGDRAVFKFEAVARKTV